MNVKNLKKSLREKEFRKQQLVANWCSYLNSHRKIDLYRKDNIEKADVNSLAQIIGKNDINSFFSNNTIVETTSIFVDKLFNDFLKAWKSNLKREDLKFLIGLGNDDFINGFEKYINFNIEVFYDYDILAYELISDIGIFKEKALKYINKNSLDEILSRSSDIESGYIGIIINGSDVIKNLRRKETHVTSSKLIVGLLDMAHRAGFYRSFYSKKPLKLKFGRFFIDEGEIGGLFGKVEWKH